MCVEGSVYLESSATGLRDLLAVVPQGWEGVAEGEVAVPGLRKSGGVCCGAYWGRRSAENRKGA